MSQLLRDKPSTATVRLETHVHTTNETRRKLAALEKCRDHLTENHPDAKALLDRINAATVVHWQEETEHFTGTETHSIGPRSFFVREVKIGRYDAAHMDRVLDELSIHPLIPDEWFMWLEESREIKYRVTPVQWKRTALVAEDSEGNEVVTGSNTHDEAFPNHAVDFPTKAEAARYIIELFPQHHPGMTPRVTLA